jgi:hypothetical protein
MGAVTFAKPSLLLSADDVRRVARHDIADKDKTRAGIVLPHLPHLLLGMDALRRLRLYIAPKEHTIYIIAVDAH